MSILFTEHGALIRWGTHPRLLGEYMGEDAMVRYGRLVSELGRRGTEVIRELDTKGGDLLAPDVTKATHVFTFPPQANAALRNSASSGVTAEGVHQERKFAVIDPELVDAHLVVAFTAEPPLLQLFDPSGDSVTALAAANELTGLS